MLCDARVHHTGAVDVEVANRRRGFCFVGSQKHQHTIRGIDQRMTNTNASCFTRTSGRPGQLAHDYTLHMHKYRDIGREMSDSRKLSLALSRIASLGLAWGVDRSFAASSLEDCSFDVRLLSLITSYSWS